MVTITMDRPHKKSQGQFQGSEYAATFTLVLLFPALILPSLKTTTNQSSLKLEFFSLLSFLDALAALYLRMGLSES